MEDSHFPAPSQVDREEGKCINKQKRKESFQRERKRRESKSRRAGVSKSASPVESNTTLLSLNPRRVLEISIRQRVILLHSRRSDSYGFNSETPGTQLLRGSESRLGHS